MNNKFLFFLVSTTFIFLCSCHKAKEPKRYVTYQVFINSGNSVAIYCANDYYFDSGRNFKKIIYKSDLDYFSSTHLADKNEPYFIKVEPENLIADTVNITTLVSINDSVVNSYSSKTFKESIVLFGFVN
jgi:hypothetical protein